MAFNPPQNPSNGDTYTYNGITYVYEDIAGSGQTGQWVAGDIGSSQLYVLKNGDTMTGDLVVGSGSPFNGNAKGSELTTEGQIWACQDDDADILFEGWKQGTAASNFSVRADGSATFASNITLDTVAGTTGEVFSVKVDSAEKIRFNGDGSAKFGPGTIGASSNSNVVQVNSGYGQIQIQSDSGGNAIYRGYNSDGNATFTVRGNGDVESTNAFTCLAQDANSTKFGVVTYDTSSSTYRIVALNNKTLFCTSSGQTGVVQSGTGWNAASSERKSKTGITPANVDDCWNAIKSVKLSNYYYKEQEDKTGVPYLGPIVDELETTNPDLVVELADSKTYNQPLLEMKAIQALQTALTRIEALEAQLTQLTGGAS